METHSTQKFENLYKRLNKEQKQAVDTIEGPVMVIAGPGTGKTSILTLRVANILKNTDTSPQSILALTFTESGAYTMRKKLVEIIGPTAYKLNINTFHGFCNEVIKSYPERFPKIIGSLAITEIDRIAIMEKIIESNDLKLLKPYGDTFYYVRHSLDAIRNLKREAIDTSNLKNEIKKQENEFKNIPDKIHEKGVHKGKMKGEFIKLKELIEKNKELLKLYEEYEKTLTKEKFYDFEDMIIEVVKTLKKDTDLLLILQETYQYILADEHQDANNAQNAVLELLSNFHKNPNLFIVGDEKQAIFRFQGASLSNFLYFQKIYPDCVLIHLKENYRSTQKILDASHSLISKNNLPEGHKRIALLSSIKNSESSNPIHIYEFNNEYDENYFVASQIKNRIEDGIKPEEIAVLYRDNKDALEISKALGKMAVPFRIESDNDILKDENIVKLLLIFEAINDTSNEEKLAKMLFVDFLGNSAISLYEFFDLCRKEKIKIAYALKEKFPEIANKIDRFAMLAKNKPFIELFEIIVKESGYIEYILKSENSLSKMETLETFFHELKEMSHIRGEYYLTNFINNLERIREHGLLTKTANNAIKSGVRLMTAHKSKGLEFDYVYIMGAYDGHWSNKKNRSHFFIPALGENKKEEQIDEERRLFYVALTRARQLVSISYHKEGRDKKELLPTQFIGEIDEKHKIFHAKEENKMDEAKIVKKITSHFASNPKDELREIKNKNYLQKIFLDQGLSVTALNNYLKCPWQYFFVNLLRLPSAQNKHQMYGTAIHNTLQTFFNKYREEIYLSKEELFSIFESNLKKAPLSEREFKETLKKGLNSLEKYFDNYKNTWNKNLITEFDIKGIHFPVTKDDINFNLLLKGKLDKLELLSEKDVNVVDYKTGNIKSRNEIEGKTKDADGNYKRQLIFYKLLLENDENKKYNMVSGELDFIEPDEKGRNKKEKFEITDEEITALKNLLTEKSIEIYKLSFWNKVCEDKKCQFCALSKNLTL